MDVKGRRSRSSGTKIEKARQVFGSRLLSAVLCGFPRGRGHAGGKISACCLVVVRCFFGCTLFVTACDLCSDIRRCREEKSQCYEMLLILLYTSVNSTVSVRTKHYSATRRDSDKEVGFIIRHSDSHQCRCYCCCCC